MTKELAPAIGRKHQKSYGVELRKKHLEEWRSSGLSMSEYCRHHDLGISTLSKWNQKQHELAELKLKPLKTAGVSMPFLPPTASSLEIRLPSGIQIRLANAADIASFKKILEVIQSCS